MSSSSLLVEFLRAAWELGKASDSEGFMRLSRTLVETFSVLIKDSDELELKSSMVSFAFVSGMRGMPFEDLAAQLLESSLANQVYDILIRCELRDKTGTRARHEEGSSEQTDRRSKELLMRKGIRLGELDKKQMIRVFSVADSPSKGFERGRREARLVWN